MGPNGRTTSLKGSHNWRGGPLPGVGRGAPNRSEPQPRETGLCEPFRLVDRGGVDDGRCPSLRCWSPSGSSLSPVPRLQRLHQVTIRTCVLPRRVVGSALDGAGADGHRLVRRFRHVHFSQAVCAMISRLIGLCFHETGTAPAERVRETGVALVAAAPAWGAPEAVRGDEPVADAEDSGRVERAGSAGSRDRHDIQPHQTQAAPLHPRGVTPIPAPPGPPRRSRCGRVTMNIGFGKARQRVEQFRRGAEAARPGGGNRHPGRPPRWEPDARSD